MGVATRVLDHQLSSTLMNAISINFELVHILMRVELVGPVISSQLSCNSCSRFPGTRVEKTLMRTLASQPSCNSCSRFPGTRVEKTLMRTLASQPSCNSCSRLPGTRVKKTLVQTLPCQLSSLFAGQEKKFLPGSISWRQTFPADRQSIFVLNLHVHKHIVF